MIRDKQHASAHRHVMDTVRFEVEQQRRHHSAEGLRELPKNGSLGWITSNAPVVFPDAPCKFYLDASPHERARRRVAQLRARGEIVDFNEVLDQIESRDRRDQSRSVGPLAVPQDAEIVDTTNMTQVQVVDHIVDRVRSVKA